MEHRPIHNRDDPLEWNIRAAVAYTAAAFRECDSRGSCMLFSRECSSIAVAREGARELHESSIRLDSAAVRA